MKKKQLIIAVLLVACVTALAVYNYVFNSKHRDIASEEATSIMQAANLFNSFKDNEATATAKYLDQVIQLSGEITELDTSGLVLSNGVQINFGHGSMPQLKQGEDITIKGRCVGYDELLELVKIDQSTLIK